MLDSKDEGDHEEAQFWQHFVDHPNDAEEDDKQQGPFLETLRSHIMQQVNNLPDFEGKSDSSAVPPMMLTLQDPLLPGGDPALRMHAALIRRLQFFVWAPCNFFPGDCKVQLLTCPHCKEDWLYRDLHHRTCMACNHQFPENIIWEQTQEHPSPPERGRP